MNAVVKDNAQLEDCKPSSPYSKRILTFSGLLPFKWDDHAACSSSGHLAFLSHFLAAGGVFDRLVASCPLKYTSHNAPAVRDVLGTAVAGIVQGFNRYRHMDFLRLDGSAARLMGLGRMMSSDSVRRALAGLGGEKGLKWVWENNLAILAPLLRHPYVLDLDPTEKTVYGFQEGAEYGYNPQKAGHRGQCYHTLGIAELRLVLGVVLLPGNRTSGREALPMLEDFLDCLPEGSRPRVVRGDVGFGTEAMMALCEGRRLPFIFKVKRSVQVRRGFESLCGDGGEWAEAGEGWRGRFAELRLQGWSKSRKILFLRRPARFGGEVRGNAAPALPPAQRMLAGFEVLLRDARPQWDWMAVATDTGADVLGCAQLYRDRGACENTFDEMKNQFGWSGFTSRDMKQTAVMAGLVALVANLWNIFTRLADGGSHREAKTSRPLLQHVLGRIVRHASRTGAVFNCFGNSNVKRIYSDIVLVINKICTAAQSASETRWMMILYYAFRKYKLLRNVFPPQVGRQMMLVM